jgi:outer membrane protein assembly factor BamA
VVLRELLFKEGDWYDSDAISKSRQNLSSLGIFRSVQIMPADRDSYEQKQPVIDLIVDVQETMAGVVAFGPGWSLNKGWNYGAEASYANIGGLGRQASVRASISEEKDQYAIGNKTLVGRKIGAGYTEPFLLDYPVDMRIKANQKAEWSGELWGLRFGGEVEFVHKLRGILDKAQASVFYGQDIARTEGSTVKEDQLLASNVRIGSVGLRLNYDRRDNPTFPLAGFLIDQEFAWARYEFGGDLSYFRWDINSAHYYGFTNDLVAAFSIGVQSYDGVGRKGDVIDVLPPSERLFSGGAETVRGYEARTLGPVVRSPVLVYNKATGTCDVNHSYSTLFGSARTTLKVELRHKISDDIALTAFSDNGNVFLSGDQLNKFAQAYDQPVAVPDNVPDGSACRSLQLTNRVQENFPYSYGELLTNPLVILNKHFFSYGASFSILLPVGSLNFSYGLPWREPRDKICDSAPDQCLTRGKRGGHWITRGEWYLNVGARF